MVFLKLMVGVQFDGHSPGVIVDATMETIDIMIIGFQHFEVKTTQMADVCCGMTPQQQASSILYH